MRYLHSEETGTGYRPGRDILDRDSTIPKEALPPPACHSRPIGTGGWRHPATTDAPMRHRTGYLQGGRGALDPLAPQTILP